MTAPTSSDGSRLSTAALWLRIGDDPRLRYGIDWGNQSITTIQIYWFSTTMDVSFWKKLRDGFPINASLSRRNGWPSGTVGPKGGSIG
jgi:hypothetical protein